MIFKLKYCVPTIRKFILTLDMKKCKVQIANMSLLEDKREHNSWVHKWQSIACTRVKTPSILSLWITNSINVANWCHLIEHFNINYHAMHFLSLIIYNLELFWVLPSTPRGHNLITILKRLKYIHDYNITRVFGITIALRKKNPFNLDNILPMNTRTNEHMMA